MSGDQQGTVDGVAEPFAYVDGLEVQGADVFDVADRRFYERAVVRRSIALAEHERGVPLAVVFVELEWLAEVGSFAVAGQELLRTRVWLVPE